MFSILLIIPWRRLLTPCLCLVCFALAVASPNSAQEEGTQSVADAARSARAKHDPTTALNAPAPHSPFSQTQLLAWQIAGVSTSDLLSQLKASGVGFPPDDSHLAPFRDAQFPTDLIAALPTVPSHLDATAPAEVPQSLIAASRAFNAKDYAAARLALEPLLQQTPNAGLYAALGNVQFNSHDLTSAKTSFEHAVQLDPTFVYAHVRLAGIYYGLENGPQTAAEAKKALQLQPDNAQARKYLSLSLSMRLQGANDRASSDSGVEDLTDLGTKDGTNQEAKDLNNQGLALMDEGEWNKAEAAFKGAIALEPKIALWYYNLGNLYVKWGGHNVLAGNAYRQAKALAPRNLAVRQNYGHFLCEGHAYNDAISEFREILKMDPDWNMARPCLYTALFNIGRTGEAAQVLAQYRYWNQTHGVPDDSAEIEADTIHPNDKNGPSL
jgi:Tfp pilus assembly protein PilF